VVTETDGYAYRGARADVILHEQYLLKYVDTWRTAKESGMVLPHVDDPDYASLDTLMVHVLKWARYYMVWICECLGLPNPGIRPVPGADSVERELNGYVEHLCSKWRTPLKDVPAERFRKPMYTAKWGIDYCIDAMLEHAVMHPIKHRFQLFELMQKQVDSDETG